MRLRECGEGEGAEKCLQQYQINHGRPDSLDESRGWSKLTVLVGSD